MSSKLLRRTRKGSRKVLESKGARALSSISTYSATTRTVAQRSETEKKQQQKKIMENSIFLLFMILWVVYGLLNQYNTLHDIKFDATTVVWTQEVLKVILTLFLFFVQDGGVIFLCQEIKQHWKMLFWYLIPAGMYVLGDVLTYINLRSFDPATLHLLGEMKLVVVAIVHQLLFKRILNRGHWVALLLITVGCVLKAFDSMEISSGATGTTTMPQPTFFNYMLVALYILLTTIAGVFNEKLLKDKVEICINLQNLCLYLDGILFLTFGIMFGISEHKSITDALSPTSIEALLKPSILASAIVMSLAGIVTSRFLKIFDSIWKSVAVALVVVILPIVSQIFFGTPITIKTVCSIIMVTLGMHLYTSQPQPQPQPQLTREAYMEIELESELFLNKNPMV